MSGVKRNRSSYRSEEAERRREASFHSSLQASEDARKATASDDAGFARIMSQLCDAAPEYVSVDQIQAKTGINLYLAENRQLLNALINHRNVDVDNPNCPRTLKFRPERDIDSVEKLVKVVEDTYRKHGRPYYPGEDRECPGITAVVNNAIKEHRVLAFPPKKDGLPYLMPVAPLAARIPEMESDSKENTEAIEELRKAWYGVGVKDVAVPGPHERKGCVPNNELWGVFDESIPRERPKAEQDEEDKKSEKGKGGGRGGRKSTRR